MMNPLPWRSYRSVKINGIDLNAENIRDHLSEKPQDDFLAEILRFLIDWWSQEEYLTFHTSGSTGVPKQILFHKDQCIASAIRTIEAFDLPKGASALLCLPLSSVAGRMMIIRALVGEWHLQTQTPSRQPRIPDTLFDFAAFTPHQLGHILQLEKQGLERIRTIILGGAPVPNHIYDCFSQFGETKFFETYGMTETLTHIAVRELHPRRQEHFRTLDGINIRLGRNENLEIQADYLSQDFLSTNDRVALLSPSEFVVLGRMDNIINSGGLKIQLEEIESIINSVCTRPFVCLGIPDNILGQKLIVAIEGEYDPSLVETIQYHLRQQKLPKNKHPKEYRFVPELLRTTNGKLKRSLA